MGLFSSKTYVAVGASTGRLTDEEPKDRLINSILNAIRTGNNIANTLKYYNLTGYTRKLEQYYRAAQNSNQFVLPFSSALADDANKDEIESILGAIEGEAVAVTQSYFEEFTAISWGRQWLFDNDSNYDYNTNTYYYRSVTWTVTDITESGSNLRIELTAGNGTISEYIPPTSVLPPTGNHYLVEYVLASAKTDKKLWYYNPLDGTYPELADSPLSLIEFYPIVPIRYNDININADISSSAYITYSKLLKYVNYDLDMLTESLTQITNEDGDLVDAPNLDLISDIFFIQGINLYTNSSEEANILYHTFQAILSNPKYVKADFDAALASNSKVAYNKLFIIANNFTLLMYYYYSETTNIQGSIGDVGTYKCTIDIQGDTGYTYSDLSKESGESGGTLSGNYLVLQHQFSKSAYTEIRIRGFYILHEINTVIGKRFHQINLEAWDGNSDLTDNQKNMVIPLSREYLDNLTVRELDKVLPTTFHVVFYASDQEKVSAFERFVFNLILPVFQFLGLVSLLFDPSGTGSTFFVRLGKYIAIGWGLEIVLTELFELAGDDEDKQIIAAAIGIYIGYEIATYEGGAGKNGELLPMDQILAATNSVSTVINYGASYQMDASNDRYDEFLLEEEAFYEELEEQADFLEVPLTLSPYYTLTYEKGTWETPDEFFSRTLNTNTEQLAFDQIAKYVDNSLNLDLLKYRTV